MTSGLDLGQRLVLYAMVFVATVWALHAILRGFKKLKVVRWFGFLLEGDSAKRKPTWAQRMIIATVWALFTGMAWLFKGLVSLLTRGRRDGVVEQASTGMESVANNPFTSYDESDPWLRTEMEKAKGTEFYLIAGYWQHQLLAYKLGITTSWEHRWRQHLTSSPLRLVPVLRMPGSEEFEDRMKQRTLQWRTDSVGEEWRENTPGMQAIVDELQAMEREFKAKGDPHVRIPA